MFRKPVIYYTLVREATVAKYMVEEGDNFTRKPGINKTIKRS